MIALPQTLDFPRENNIREICNSLLTLLQKKDTGLYMHSQQVANYSACIAAKLGLPAAEIASIKSAALLHDIGHLSVPNTILKKSPYLSTREMATYKRHCQAGASMLENIPEFAHIIDIIYSHHEKWDGTGYPKRFKGVNIPLGARIIAVANYYDRIVNPCTHYWQKTPMEAIKEMNDKAGTDFDPNVVRAFLESIIPSKIR